MLTKGAKDGNFYKK